MGLTFTNLCPHYYGKSEICGPCAMKVLFFNNPPFFLAHGGMQTWTEALMRSLAQIGVEVEPERWWDDQQKGDIIHYFLRPPIVNIRAAHDKGFKMVLTDCLDQTS